MEVTSVIGYATTDTVSKIWSVPGQFWATIWAALVVIGVCIWAFWVMRKADHRKAPTTSQLIVTETIEGLDNYYVALTGGKIRKAYPYFTTIILFLSAGIFVGMLGFDSPASSIMFTFALALISFLGIYVIGIASKGVIGFIKHKYANPLELFSQFSPLLSLAVRLFGGTFAFGVLFVIFQLIFQSMGLDMVAMFWPIINIFWFWALKGVDVFLSMIQAVVFVSLTSIYWSMEYSPKEKKDASGKASESTVQPEKTKVDQNPQKVYTK